MEPKRIARALNLGARDVGCGLQSVQSGVESASGVADLIEFQQALDLFRTFGRLDKNELQNVTTRTEQRRVLRATGLTLGAIHQIERARRAAYLLKKGTPILDVVHEAGYYDQAHLTRSLQRFIGQSPARIAQGKEQLSFLYNKAQR